MNPRRIVTCEVQRPSNVSGSDCDDDLNKSSQGHVQSDQATNIIVDSQVTPPPTPRVRCLSNHRGSKDVVRMCDLLQRKVEQNTEILTNHVSTKSVGTQVNFGCNCSKANNVSQCHVETQTNSDFNRGRVSFDINVNLNM